MTRNATLAALIIDQVQHDENHDDWDTRNAQIAALLDAAITDAPSRIDLRNRLQAAARDTNRIVYADLAEAIAESLSDRIRDLDEDIARLEINLVPSRLAMGTTIGLMLGAFGAVLYGSADIITATAISASMVAMFFALQAYRKRAFGTISRLRRRRADYDSFRKLLRAAP